MHKHFKPGIYCPYLKTDAQISQSTLITIPAPPLPSELRREHLFFMPRANAYFVLPLNEGHAVKGVEII